MVLRRQEVLHGSPATVGNRWFDKHQARQGVGGVSSQATLVRQASGAVPCADARSGECARADAAPRRLAQGQARGPATHSPCDGLHALGHARAGHALALSAGSTSVSEGPYP